MLDLYEELRALTARLEGREVGYALCGGLAMAVYGTPRATVDIDLLMPSESLPEATALARQLGYTFEAAPMTFADGAIQIQRLSKIDPESSDVLTLEPGRAGDRSNGRAGGCAWCRARGSSRSRRFEAAARTWTTSVA